MLFLIDYDRRAGKIVFMRIFDDSQRRLAYEERFALERSRDREGTGHEVVLLEASSEQVIRRTHSRYFGDLTPITQPSRTDGNGDGAQQ